MTLTVIIPTYNEEHFIVRCLESVLSQTLQPLEVIVVDGGSSDKTGRIIRSYSKKHPLVKGIYTNTANLSLQRNVGGEAAKSDWLLFIDADSVLLPYALERIAAFIKTHDCGHFTSWCQSDSETNADAILSLSINTLVEMAVKLKRPVALGPFGIVKKSVFDAVGGYNVSLGYGEDYDFSKRIHDSGISFGVIRETLYQYSLRRFRRDGTLKTLRLYARGIASILVTRKPANMPGYEMGGKSYTHGSRSRKK